METFLIYFATSFVAGAFGFVLGMFIVMLIEQLISLIKGKR